MLDPNVIQTTLYRATYDELKGLVEQNKLVVGGGYLLTDFKTVYIQPVTNEIKEGPIEPLILVATSPNTFNSKVSSTEYVDDIVHYSLSGEDCDWNVEGQSKGQIIYRKDVKRENEAPYDLRAIRYEHVGIERCPTSYNDHSQMDGSFNNSYFTYSTDSPLTNDGRAPDELLLHDECNTLQDMFEGGWTVIPVYNDNDPLSDKTGKVIESIDDAIGIGVWTKVFLYKDFDTLGEGDVRVDIDYSMYCPFGGSLKIYDVDADSSFDYTLLEPDTEVMGIEEQYPAGSTNFHNDSEVKRGRRSFRTTVTHGEKKRFVVVLERRLDPQSYTDYSGLERSDLISKSFSEGYYGNICKYQGNYFVSIKHPSLFNYLPPGDDNSTYWQKISASPNAIRVKIDGIRVIRKVYEHYSDEVNDYSMDGWYNNMSTFIGNSSNCSIAATFRQYHLGEYLDERMGRIIKTKRFNLNGCYRTLNNIVIIKSHDILFGPGGFDSVIVDSSYISAGSKCSITAVRANRCTFDGSNSASLLRSENIHFHNKSGGRCVLSSDIESSGGVSVTCAKNIYGELNSNIGGICISDCKVGVNSALWARQASVITVGNQTSSVSVERSSVVNIGSRDEFITIYDSENIDIGDFSHQIEIGKSTKISIKGDQSHKLKLYQSQNVTFDGMCFLNEVVASNIVNIGYYSFSNKINDSERVTIGSYNYENNIGWSNSVHLSDNCFQNNVMFTAHIRFDMSSFENAIKHSDQIMLGSQTSKNILEHSRNCSLGELTANTKIDHSNIVEIGIECSFIRMKRSTEIRVASRVSGRNCLHVSDSSQIKINDSANDHVIFNSRSVEIGSDSGHTEIFYAENVSVGNSSNNIEVMRSINVDINSHSHDNTVVDASDVSIGGNSCGNYIVKANTVKIGTMSHKNVVNNAAQITIGDLTNKSSIKDQVVCVTVGNQCDLVKVQRCNNLKIGNLVKESSFIESNNNIIGDQCKKIKLSAGCHNNRLDNDCGLIDLRHSSQNILEQACYSFLLIDSFNNYIERGNVGLKKRRRITPPNTELEGWIL